MSTYIDSTLTISGRKLPSTYTRTIRTTVSKIRRGDLIAGYDSHVAYMRDNIGTGRDDAWREARLADGTPTGDLGHPSESVYVTRTYTRKAA